MRLLQNWMRKFLPPQPPVLVSETFSDTPHGLFVEIIRDEEHPLADRFEIVNCFRDPVDERITAPNHAVAIKNERVCSIQERGTVPQFARNSWRSVVVMTGTFAEELIFCEVGTDQPFWGQKLGTE